MFRCVSFCPFFAVRFDMVQKSLFFFILFFDTDILIFRYYFSPVNKTAKAIDFSDFFRYIDIIFASETKEKRYLIKILLTF